MLLWNKTINVSVVSFSQRHIDCHINGECGRWRFTGLYGHTITNQIVFLWELLRKLYATDICDDKSWLVR